MEINVQVAQAVRITPQGGIVVGDAVLQRSFSGGIEGVGAGLVVLGTSTWGADSTAPAVGFLQRMVHEAFTRLAHFCVEHENELAPAEALLPSEPELRALLERLPPMSGAEYVTRNMLLLWHEKLAEYCRIVWRGRDCSAAEWLASLGAPWDQVGRVFFHLAENKEDISGTLPFAFLATFAHKTTASGAVRHLPLAQAHQLYADNFPALRAVLKPMQDAMRSLRERREKCRDVACCVSREKSDGESLLGELVEGGGIFVPQAWTAEQARRFLHEIPNYEQAGIMVRMVNLWSKPPARLQVRVTGGVMAGDNSAEGEVTDLHVGAERGLGVRSLLRFSVAASLGGQHLTPEQIEELLAHGAGLIRFHGEWIDVDAAKIEQLLGKWHTAARMLNSSGIPLVQGLRMLLSGRAEQVEGLPQPDEDVVIEPSDALQEMLARMTGLAGGADEINNALRACMLRVDEPLRSLLRPYQQEGVRYLHHTTSFGFGACLADDMGLGKTLQALAWLTMLKNDGILNSGGAALVVAPASLLANWRDEAARFAPALRTMILHPDWCGGVTVARVVRQLPASLAKVDVVITTYGMVARLGEALAGHEFAALVLDEAQALKNADSGRTKAVRGLQSARRVALTGTPIENNLGELWSVMELLNPTLLGTRKSFDAFVKGLGANFEKLKRLIRPFILRRMKTDEALVPDLPDKTEQVAYCHLTPKQASLYKAQVNALLAVLEEPDPAKRLMAVLPFLSRLKQICNHPDQFTGLGDFSPLDSGKMLRLEQLAHQIAERQEKVLVFTQFRAMLDPIHHLLTRVFGRKGLILHGGTPIAERHRMVQEFQGAEDDAPPFFVLSLKAAGTGLTLTNANHVIHFDRWWNPAVENQATDRAYRIGQHRNVLVHPMVSVGTIEERIDAMLRAKQQLSDSLLSTGMESMLAAMSPQELRELFK